MDSQSRVTTCSISITLRMPALLLAFLEVAKDGPDTLLHQAIIATSSRINGGLIPKITAKEKGVSRNGAHRRSRRTTRLNEDYYSTQPDRCNRFLHRFLPGSPFLFRYPILSGFWTPFGGLDENFLRGEVKVKVAASAWEMPDSSKGLRPGIGHGLCKVRGRDRAPSDRELLGLVVPVPQGGRPSPGVSRARRRRGR